MFIHHLYHERYRCGAFDPDGLSDFGYRRREKGVFMSEQESVVASLFRQQEVLATFGELALRSDSLDEILTESCRLVSRALGTDLAKVMQLQEDGTTLLVRAGVGWKHGVVGEVTVQADQGSSEGFALKTGQPVISHDISTETRFEYADFIKDNGVRAIVSVIIIGTEGAPLSGYFSSIAVPRASSTSTIRASCAAMPI